MGIANPRNYMRDATVSAASASVAGHKAFPFYLLLFCVVLEYSRPQDIIPGLAVLRLPLISSSLLGLSLILSGKLSFSDKQTKLFLLFLAQMIPHIPLAINNYWALWTLYDLLPILIVYLGIITLVRSIAAFTTLMSVWIGIQAFLSVYGIWTGGKGVGGFLGDENDFAVVMNMALPYTFFLVFHTPSRLRKLGLFLLSASIAFATITSFSRGGFLGLIAVGLYCWLFSPKKMQSALLVFMISVLAVTFAPERYGDRIKTIWEEGTTSTTAEDRIYEWKIGWEMFLDNPVFGVGQNNFPFRFGQYEGDRTLFGASRAGRAAHSLYFTLLPELGIVGAILYLLMIQGIVKDLLLARKLCHVDQTVAHHEQSLKRRVRGFANAMGGSLLGFLVSSAFVSTLYYPCFWYLMAFAAALKNACLSGNRHNFVDQF